MAEFIKGIDLCEGFFNDIAKPIITSNYPDLLYSAGLIGYGSDVLGYDDITSTDHMWGPRFYLFLRNEDIHIADDIMNLFSREFPYTYKGYSVNFSKPDQNDNGIRHGEFITHGLVNPLVFIYTFESFIEKYIGKFPMMGFDEYDWLSFSENRLLCLTAGRIFVDLLNVEMIRNMLTYYPKDVWLYLIASQWAIIAEEQAFVKRCSDCDDELGSNIVCMRIIERIMRLCFLYSKKYAPYSKWFGTAFKKLDTNCDIKTELELASNAICIIERENHLISALMYVGMLHNQSGITEEIELKVSNYYGRSIKVIYADKFADATREKLKGSLFESMPLIGTMSQTGSLCSLYDNPNKGFKSINMLYRNLK